jgi:antigen flippase
MGTQMTIKPEELTSDVIDAPGAVEAPPGGLGSRDFVRKVAATLVTRVMLVAIGLVTTVLVARILGPTGRGLYAVATTVGMLGVQFGNLGLHASNTYYVAKDRTLLPVLVGNTLVVAAAIGGGSAVTAYTLFALWPSAAPVSGMLLVLALAWIPLGLCYLLLQNLLLGIQEIRAFNTIELATKALAVAFILIVAVSGRVSTVNVFAAGLVALGISFWWSLHKLVSSAGRGPSTSLDVFRDNIRYGLKAYFATLFMFLTLRMNLLMVGYIRGAEMAGYYSVAANLGEMVSMLPTVIGTVLFPKLSAMTQDEARWEFTKKTVLATTGLVAVVGPIAVLLARPIVATIFGNEFLPAVPAFIWLMPGVAVLSVNSIFMNFFASVGMPPITVYSPALAAVANIVLNYTLIPRLGIVGAAIASSAAYGLMLMCSLHYLAYRKPTK